MSDEEYERLYHYIKKEFLENNDYYLGLKLVQDIEAAANEKRQSALDYIFKKDSEFYGELFITIFIRPNGGFEFYESLIPHLKIKFLLNYIESIIIDLYDPLKGKLLDLYQNYYNYLIVNAVIKKSENGDKSFPKEMLITMLPGGRFSEGGASENIVDIELIFQARNFLESNKRNTLVVYENYLMDLSPPDSFDEMENQYQFWSKVAKEDPIESRMLIDFYINLIDDVILASKELDHAENIVDRLINDFGDHPDVEEYYLRLKSVNQKLEDAMAYIENKYDKNEIESNPELLSYLSEYHQLHDDIPKAMVTSRKAFEASGKNAHYFTKYCKVLLLLETKDAEKELKKFIFKDKKTINPSQLLSLLARFFRRDIQFTKELLDYYSGKYPENEQHNRGLNHIIYLNHLAKYYMEMENYAMHEMTLFKLIKDYPQHESGYRQLYELYSQTDIKDCYNISKALEYARKCAEARGVPPEYYIGNCFFMAGDYQKAKENLKEFVEQEPIPPAFNRAYMNLCKVHLMFNDKESACNWAGKYIDSFDESTRLFMYQDTTMNIEDLLESDLLFFALVAENCIKYKKKAESLLQERKTWVNALTRSLDNQRQTKESRQLKAQIVELERDIQSIKKKYCNIDFTVQENVDNFFNEIMENESFKEKIQKQINHSLWDEVEGNLPEIIPFYDRIPDIVTNYIKTAEFLILANHEESDFSGVILCYAKAFETILDEKVSIPYIGSIKNKKKKLRTTYKSDITVQNLFPQNGEEHKSITIDQWYHFIDNMGRDRYKTEDPLTMNFEYYIKKLGESELNLIKTLIYNLKDSLYGSFHTKFISREDAESDIERFRGAINGIIQILYK